MLSVYKLLFCLLSTMVVAAPERDKRAVGIFTLGDYYSTFTQGSRDILTSYNLLNKNMVRDNDVSPPTERIEWTQTSRCFFGCMEDYLLVDYYQDGVKTNPVMKVFVARELGNPPQQFSTGGYQGKLHFGHLNFGGDWSINHAIYFVIHPNDWYPYQHRFKTNTFTEFFQDSLWLDLGGWTAGAAIGSILPGPGSVIGGVVGEAIARFQDDIFGDYLRYIG